MTHIYKLLFASLLLPLFSTAQSKYKPGYVVTIKGDTVRGFVDYQGWDANPTSISFKSAITDRDKKVYNLNDISVFNVNSEATYKKYTCNISTDITNPAHLVEGRDTSFKTAAVFIQVLQQGKNLALYSYTDDQKTRFYIGEAPSYTPTELVYRLYFDPDAQSASRTVNENTYQKQLFALANKYNALDDQLNATFQKTDYNRGDLMAIVGRINNISKQEFAQKYTDKTRLNFYVSAGVNGAYTNAGNSFFVQDGGKPSYTFYSPFAAIGMDFNPSPASGTVELRVDLSVSGNNFNDTYTLNVNPYSPAKSSYNQLSFTLQPEVIVNLYNATSFKFYLGAGISASYSSFSNPFFGNPTTSSQTSGFPQQTYWFLNGSVTYLLTAGFKIDNKFEVFAKYAGSQRVTRETYFDFYESNVRIGASYFFGK